ncbi:hypothetical protein M8J77_021980 [Diaphorina citri]|nr:hypothetical protein M8J77_021980 [Diaphorina citri]
MEGLDVLKKQRAILRSSVTRTCNNIIAILKDETVNNDEVAGLYELLLERFQELKVSDEKISLEQSSLDEDALVKEQERVDEYTALYFQTKGMVDKLTVKVQSDVSEYNSCQRQIQGQALYKLPPLKLKEFGGELNQWLPFWAQFQKIHEDPNMPAVDKLGYLSMCIVKDSPAQRVINSYPATEAMYPEIVKALKDRFGRPDLLTELYIREMMSLVLQNTISKDKMSIPDLYDRLQSHLRNLDSLGVTTENYASILLPLVSSSLSSELLQIWERTCSATVNRDSDATSKEKLNSLLSFLRCEVEQSQKLKLAQSNFGLTADTDQHIKARREAPVRHTRDSKQERFATATGLTNNTFQEVVCIFCQNKHKPYECMKAKDMPQEKKQELIKESRTCFICLRSGHRAFQCKANVKCKKCSARHYDVMCSAKSTSSCIASNRVDSVLLQTLVVKLFDPFGGRSKDVRVLIDTGSQRSYIVKNLAQEMGYKPFETVSVRHALFGGGVTKAVDHNVFRLKVSSVLSDYTCNFEAMDQDQICLSVPISIAGPWMQELSAHDIQLCDSSTSQEVDILIGSDIAAKLWTGRVHKLECGLVAMETHLGWTLSGKMPSVSTASQEDRNTVAAIVTSLYVREACVSDLWSLDVLGIQNPSEKMLQEDIDLATEEYFLSTVRVNSQERFEVRLPFLSEHPPLSENLTIAKMRLASTQKKLEKDGYTEAYQEVLTGWEKDGIIEKVSAQSVDKPAFYMPHKHVIKPGSTTPVRPVFDASAKEVGKHSLNDCLEKGPNLIKNIPSCLARFRTDQGTTLVGFESACQKLDWDKITQYSTAKKIEWKLNPPSAPWWGGWWERMVGILKTLLRRVLGRSSVNYEELLTLISECEAIVNARPLTYIPDGEHELAAITPAMFLHDLDEVGFPEYDFIGPKDFGERLKYRNDLKKQLRERFRSEYLGQLKLFSSKKKEHDLKEGDIVLIGDDNVKRLDWPMGRVVELVKGHDKCVRMVRVKTASGILSRPVQRLYLLETVEQPDGEPMENTESTIVPDIDMQCEEVSVSSDHVDYDSQKVQNLEIVAPERLTRRGRSIRKPSRFIQ